MSVVCGTHVLRLKFNAQSRRVRRMQGINAPAWRCGDSAAHPLTLDLSARLIVMHQLVLAGDNTYDPVSDAAAVVGSMSATATQQGRPARRGRSVPLQGRIARPHPPPAPATSTSQNGGSGSGGGDDSGGKRKWSWEDVRCSHSNPTLASLFADHATRSHLRTVVALLLDALAHTHTHTHTHTRTHTRTHTHTHAHTHAHTHTHTAAQLH
jgi:hypothetical protein